MRVLVVTRSTGTASSRRSDREEQRSRWQSLPRVGSNGCGLTAQVADARRRWAVCVMKSIVCRYASALAGCEMWMAVSCRSCQQ